MSKKETYLTAQGQKDLEEELEHLSAVSRREVAVRIHTASETGGTVDNAEYDEAKNEQAFVEGRISDLQGILFNAVVATAVKKTKGAVGFGSAVSVVTDEGVKRSYTVVGSTEAAPLEGKISFEAPVGKALMGHKVGDKIDVETPSGVVKLTIIKIY